LTPNLASAAGRTSVGSLFRHRATANRDRIALVDGKRQLTYGALDERTDPVLAELWDNPKDAAYDER